MAPHNQLNEDNEMAILHLMTHKIKLHSTKSNFKIKKINLNDGNYWIKHLHSKAIAIEFVGGICMTNIVHCNLCVET